MVVFGLRVPPAACLHALLSRLPLMLGQGEGRKTTRTVVMGPYPACIASAPSNAPAFAISHSTQEDYKSCRWCLDGYWWNAAEGKCTPVSLRCGSSR